MLCDDAEIVESGARVIWERGVGNVAIKVCAVALDEDEAVVSDERGGLWYISEINEIRASPLNVVVWAGNGPRAYCPNSAYTWLALVRGRLLFYNKMFCRDIFVSRLGECAQEENEALITKFDKGASVKVAASHPAGIRCLGQEYEVLATGDAMGCVRCFALFDSSHRSATSAHTSSPVTAVTIARVGVVVSGNEDGAVRIWAAVKSELRLQCEMRPGSPHTTCLACIRDQNEPLLAVGGNDGSLSLWSVAEAVPRLVEVHDDTLEPLVKAITTHDALLVLDAAHGLRSYALDNTRLGLASFCGRPAASLSSTAAGDVYCCLPDKPYFYRLFDHDEEKEEKEQQLDDKEETPLTMDDHQFEETVEEESEDEEEDPPPPPPEPEDLDELDDVEPRPPPKEEEEEQLQAPRIVPPMPTIKPMPPVPDQGPRREDSNLPYAKPLAWDEDGSLAAFEERRAQETRRLALIAQEEARRADAALAEARRAATVGLAKPRLAPVDAKLPPRKRMVAKQVDKSWLERRDKLRPQPQDFAIPHSSKCLPAPGRLHAPPLPLPLSADKKLLPLIPTNILVP